MLVNCSNCNKDGDTWTFTAEYGTMWTDYYCETCQEERDNTTEQDISEFLAMIDGVSL